MVRYWDHRCSALQCSRKLRSTSRGYILVRSREARTRREPLLGPAEPSRPNHGVITLDLSAAGRSGGRGETRRRPRKTGGQEDRRGGVLGYLGEKRGGRVPSRRLSPCTLLSYKGGYPLRWPQGRGKEEGGGRRVFFSPPPCLREIGARGKGCGKGGNERGQ